MLHINVENFVFLQKLLDFLNLIIDIFEKTLVTQVFWFILRAMSIDTSSLSIFIIKWEGCSRYKCPCQWSCQRSYHCLPVWPYLAIPKGSPAEPRCGFSTLPYLLFSKERSDETKWCQKIFSSEGIGVEDFHFKTQIHNSLRGS